jgi:hypothetical protein
MRWPFEVRIRGANPSPLPVPPAPVTASSRPSTVIGFLSDLSNNPKQAATFVFVVGSLILIASLCFTGICFATIEASKEIKGVQVRYIWTLGGISGASLLSLTAALATRWVRKSGKGARGNAARDAQKDGTQK